MSKDSRYYFPPTFPGDGSLFLLSNARAELSADFDPPLHFSGAAGDTAAAAGGGGGGGGLGPGSLVLAHNRVGDAPADMASTAVRHAASQRLQQQLAPPGGAAAMAVGGGGGGGGGEAAVTEPLILQWRELGIPPSAAFGLDPTLDVD